MIASGKPSVSPPVLLSAVVLAGGANLRLTFDVGVDAGDGAGINVAAGFYLHATNGDLVGAADLSTSSGDTTNETVLNLDGLARSISAGETLTLDYTHQLAGSQVTNHVGGVELASFSGRSVTNNA